METTGNISPAALKPGAIFEYTKTITGDDIRQFAQLTGDFGRHHVPEEGPAVAHGLLVAGLVTKLGGDMNFISQSMTIHFVGAVYAGETVTGRVELLSVKETPLRYKIRMNCSGVLSDGRLALQGHSHGYVMNDSVAKAQA